MWRLHSGPLLVAARGKRNVVVPNIHCIDNQLGLFDESVSELLRVAVAIGIAIAIAIPIFTARYLSVHTCIAVNI